MTVHIQHVDTCTPDYVLDHCNGDNETLFGVIVDGATTCGEVKANLIWEGERSDSLPDSVTDAAFAAAVNALFADDSDAKAFCPALDVGDPDDGYADDCQAWFRVSWGD